MVPEYSFSHAISSCQFGRLPEGFYDRVEEGSIILKKSKSFTFWREGVVLNGGDESIQSDLVILATGYRGDQKLRNLFGSPFQKLLAGSSNTTIAPLYRYKFYFNMLPNNTEQISRKVGIFLIYEHHFNN